MDPSIQDQSQPRQPRLVLMWRGNILAPDQPINHATRFAPLVAALSNEGLAVSSLVYFDDQADRARQVLLNADGVMVWINPLQDGQNRAQVDSLLRDIAASGVWVSAHPNTILKLGVKEVLYTTRSLGWGSDTGRYLTLDELRAALPGRLASGPRVLKPLRGNDGKGVIKVTSQASDPARLTVQSASDDSVVELSFDQLATRLGAYFADGGFVIDQAFNDNVQAGMVRCYMSLDRVVGFSQQSPRAPSGSPTPMFGMNSAKTMHPADAPVFADLRAAMERDWTPGLQRLLGLSRSDLPALWDADFFLRPPSSASGPAYVLCEINVSSVSPFPDAAVPAIAATVAEILRAR